MKLHTIIISLVFVFGLIVGLGKTPFRFHTQVLPLFLQSTLAQCEREDVGMEYFESVFERCYTQQLVKLIKQYGLAMAIQTFSRYMESPKGASLSGQRCHALAHEIGNTAAKTGEDPHTIFTQCKDMCSTLENPEIILGIDLGCMNGAAHTWVLLSRSFEEAIQKCDDRTVSQEVREGCYHGLGHGLYEQFGGDVIPAVSNCLTITDPKGQYQCSHAIFMERPQGKGSGLPQDVGSYCASLPQSVSPSCFAFAGAMEYLRSGDIHRAQTWCRRNDNVAPEECLLRTGEALYISAYDPADIARCFVGNNQDQVCTQGFLRAAANTVRDVFGNEAMRACSFVPQGSWKNCVQQVIDQVTNLYGKDVATALCAALETEVERKACMEVFP
jgi:hypothetical protein